MELLLDRLPLKKNSFLTIQIQFFLDAGQNQRGIFLRVTEQTRFYRQAITSKFLMSIL